MKLNPDKCHLILSTKEQTTLKIDNLHIKNAFLDKLLCMNFDYKLNFTMHIEKICQKSWRKINGLASFAPYMTPSKRRILTNAFLKSQFNYCLLIWMCCNRSLNNKLNWFHEWYLCIQILKNFSKEMVLCLFTIKISDF